MDPPGGFEYVKILGHGGFGRVVLVKSVQGQNERLMAVKQMKKYCSRNRGDSLADRLYTRSRHEMEVTILQALARMVFCLQMVKTFETPHYFYLLTEYCSGGSLRDYIHYQTSDNRKNGVSSLLLTQRQFVILAAELTTGLGTIHSKGIIHRDLKPANVLIDSRGHVKIADFGSGCLLRDGQQYRRDVMGTNKFHAPEVSVSVRHDKMVDWYGMAITLLTTFIGRCPVFDTEEKDQAIMRACRKLIKMSPGVSKSELTTITAFLAALMVSNPTKRLGSKGGDREIKMHELFASTLMSPFDWMRLQNLQMEPPFPVGKNFSHPS